jgi:DNA-binding response OmpR family regulator
MNILIVDDEELIRNVIKEYSINEGYNIFEASDGVKAIDMVKNLNMD